MKKKPAGKFRTKEEWRVIRAIVEKEGMTLTAAAEKAGIPYSTVQGRARIECWNPPHGIVRGRPRDTEILAAQAKKIEAKLAREEVLLMAEASLVKAQDLEVLARKSLMADSARLRVAISRRVREIVARLEDPGVPVRSAAQALGALAPILRLIDGWSRALDIEGVELARTSNDAISMGPSAVAPEQPRTLQPVSQLPKEEALPGAAKQPAPASRMVTRERATSLLAPEQPVHNPPSFPDAKAAFERARAEHRQACRLKYR